MPGYPSPLGPEHSPDWRSRERFLTLLETDVERHRDELDGVRADCERRLREQQQRHESELRSASRADGTSGGSPIAPPLRAPGTADSVASAETDALRQQLQALQSSCGALREATRAEEAAGYEEEEEGSSADTAPLDAGPQAAASVATVDSPAALKRARVYLKGLQRERSRLQFDLEARCRVLWYRSDQVRADDSELGSLTQEAELCEQDHRQADAAISRTSAIVGAYRKEDRAAARLRTLAAGSIRVRGEQLASLHETLRSRARVLWKLRTDLEAAERASDDWLLRRRVPPAQQDEWVAAVERRSAARREAATDEERMFNAQRKLFEATDGREALREQAAEKAAAAAADLAKTCGSIRGRLRDAMQDGEAHSSELRALRREGRPELSETAEQLRERTDAVHREADQLQEERQELRQYIAMLNAKLMAMADELRSLQDQQQSPPPPQHQHQQLQPHDDDDDEGRFHELPAPASPRGLRATRGRRGAFPIDPAG